MHWRVADVNGQHAPGITCYLSSWPALLLVGVPHQSSTAWVLLVWRWKQEASTFIGSKKIKTYQNIQQSTNCCSSCLLLWLFHLFFICWWTWRNSGQVFLLEDPLANQKCFPRSPVQKPRVAWESRRLVEQWAVWISRMPKHQPKTIASQRPSRLNKQKPHICASGAWFFSSIFQPFFWDQSWNCKHRSMVT